MTATTRSTRIAAHGVGLAFLGFVAVSWPNSTTLAGTTAEAERVAQGRELFLRDWVPGDPRSHGGDGLGPFYNDTSCVACHNLGAPGGGGPASKNTEIITLLPRVRLRVKADLDGEKVEVKAELDEKKVEVDELHPAFRFKRSVLLHRFGTDPEYRLWRLRRTEGVELADMAEIGGGEEIEQIKELVQMKSTPPGDAFSPSRARSHGESRTKGALPFGSMVALSRRNAPALFGAGLIDAIPVAALRAAAVEPHPNFPSVRGRVNAFGDGRVGRFGWKAQTPSLKEFVETACAMELGLEVPSHHQADPPLDLDSKKSIGLDLTQDECDALTAYVASIPPPIERPGPPNLQAGRDLFARVGCAACHVPTLGSVTGTYSDLLLHDMGTDLSDSSGYYGSTGSGSSNGPTGKEWRTSPLWGFRDSGPYLHDGRAETLEQAVAFHGGQGEPSAKLFFALSLRERLKVQSFLNSLVAPAVVR